MDDNPSIAIHDELLHEDRSERFDQESDMNRGEHYGRQKRRSRYSMC